MKTLLIWIPGMYLGGAEDYAIRIAREAKDRGWKTKLLIPSPVCALQISQKDPSLHILNSLSRDFLANSSTRGLQFVCATKTLVAFYVWHILKERPQAIHAVLPWHDYSPEFISACRISQVPTLTTFQLVAPGFPPSQYSIKTFKRFSGSRHVMCAISNNNKKLLAEYYGLDEQIIECIPNRPAETTFTDSSDWSINDRNHFLRSHSLPLDKKIILTVAALRHQKGHDLIINAARDILLHHPNTFFLFVGDGPLRQELEAQAYQNGLVDHIRFYGKSDQVVDFLKSADLFLFPTRFEGESFALLEAARMNLPIVASHASGIPETLRSGIDALLFEPNNSVELGRNLVFALSNPHEMKAMAKSAQLWISQMKESEMMDNTFLLLDKIT
jgi:glycosyltransferase involved in cell wall biosynthesis